MKSKLFKAIKENKIADLKMLLSYAKIKPCVNQIEMHPFVPNLLELIDFCQKNQIPVQAHTVLAGGKFFNNKTIADISKEYKISPAQVMIKWCLQLGCDVVLSTRNVDHLKEWMMDDFKFSDKTMDQLNNLSKDTPHKFYNHFQAFPIKDKELASLQNEDINSFVATAVQQLKIDHHRMEENLPISEYCMLIPNFKNNKNRNLAELISAKLFPSKIEDFDNDPIRMKVSQCSKLVNYLKNMRTYLQEQRKNEAKTKKKNICCLKPKLPGLSEAVLNPEPMPVDVAPETEVKPFFNWLQDPNSEKPVAALTFIRGTVFPDGRMDFCKQVTGNKHIASLCQSVKANVLQTGHIQHFLLGNNVACDGDDIKAAQAMADLIQDPKIPIKTWYLAGNEIGPKCIDILCQAFEKDNSTTALWLKRNPVGPLGAQRLGQMLKINSSIHTLDLHNCGLLDEGVSKFVSACTNDGKALSGLKHLYLDANGITEKGAEYLVPLIKLNSQNLESIFLGINRINDKGIILIAEAFGESKSLKRFNSTSNSLTDECIEAIYQMAMKCKNLISLDLGYYKSTADMGESPNYIGLHNEEKSSDLLCKLIIEHPNLEYLSIVNNKYSNNSIEKIAEAASQVNLSKKRKFSIDMSQYISTKDNDFSENKTFQNMIKEGFDYVPLTWIRVHSKEEFKNIKCPPDIGNIDSIYRTSMK